MSIVKNETGHDFSLYKKSTINRMIERRMNVHDLDTRERYTRYLLANPQEIDLLFKDLLIEVTSFFRNPDAFGSLKEVLRKTFFATRSKKEDLRVWVAACSTGEEAYSIGMIFRELMDETGRELHVRSSDQHQRRGDRHRPGWFLSFGDR